MRNIKGTGTSKSAISSSNPNRVNTDDAIKRIKKWKDTYGATVPTKAFFINLADLIALIEEVLKSDLSAVGIRGYLGIREEINANGEKVPVNELLLVAAVLNVDCSDTATVETPVLTVTDSTDYIYDLTSPCPPMCDPISVLYQATVDMPQKLALKDLKKRPAKSPVKKK